jgi:lipopolysaccharide export LptBFGC system permease protein LptF
MPRHAWIFSGGSADSDQIHPLYLAYQTSLHPQTSLIAIDRLVYSKGKIEVAHTTRFARPHAAKDEWLIETEQMTQMNPQELIFLLKKGPTHLDTSCLSIPMLRIRAELDPETKWQSYAEIQRRVTLSLSPLSLAWVGFIAALHLPRAPRSLLSKWLIPCSFALLLPISLLLGKDLKTNPYLAPCVFFLPHLFSCFFTFQQLRRQS